MKRPLFNLIALIAGLGLAGAAFGQLHYEKSHGYDAQASAATTAAIPALAATGNVAAPVAAVTPTMEPSAPAAKNINCAAPTETPTSANADGPIAGSERAVLARTATGPKVVFQLNAAQDAPTVLRFVTNYLAVEPGAEVAVVGYAGGIDFMLEGARDPGGKPYAEQLAALAARGVAFKVCNNTLKARNLTAAAVSPPAMVVPGAVNEIIRLQTKEGYAYFQH
jgi:intracellular sulfur oxidation DsrE/DsrF family protein